MTGDLAAPVAAVDDPEWVLAMYREAKALITDLREESLPAEWRERVEDFCIKTAMGCQRRDRFSPSRRAFNAALRRGGAR